MSELLRYDFNFSKKSMVSDNPSTAATTAMTPYDRNGSLTLNHSNSQQQEKSRSYSQQHSQQAAHV